MQTESSNSNHSNRVNHRLGIVLSVYKNSDVLFVHSLTMLGHPPGRLKIAGVYRVCQPMENFKLRLRIVQQKSLLAELFDSDGETRDSNFLEIEEREFSWQEKIFSPFERFFYRDEKNCVTDVHKDYHRLLIEADNNDEDESNQQDSRLFTYTKEDSYYPDNSPLTTYHRSILSTRNENALPTVKNRKPFAERYNKNVIDEYPSNTRIRTNHYLYKDRSAMYILADLSSKDETTLPVSLKSNREILLCTVTYNKASRTLTIDPDFNNDDFYTVEATGMGYDYSIEHISKQRNEDEPQQQIDSLRHLQETHETRLHDEGEIFHEMELPPPHILRVFLNLGIECATDFPYDAVFATYLIDLPKHWSTSEADKLSGRSQRCRMVRGTANFSYVTEIPLDFDLKSLNDENIQPSWPYVLFSVASLDSWTRYRIEGYASISLPPSPGYHSSELHTWRPITGLVNGLRRFFTGGTSELEDMTYCGIPNAHENSSRLEKVQLKVIPAGKLKINLSIAHQSKIFTKNRDFQRDTIDRLNAGTLITSVDNVLEQFKAARERMIQAMNL